MNNHHYHQISFVIYKVPRNRHFFDVNKMIIDVMTILTIKLHYKILNLRKIIYKTTKKLKNFIWFSKSFRHFAFFSEGEKVWQKKKSM